MTVERIDAKSGTAGTDRPAPAEPLSASMIQLAQAIAAAMVKAQLLQLFQDWLTGAGTRFALGANEIAWFISKKSTTLINAWLSNKGMAVLHETAPGWGAVVISRDRVEHVRDERMRKDGVDLAGTEELLTALFINGAPKYAPHADTRKYPHQLLMVDPSYKATNSSASGESPVAALQWKGLPRPHLRLETAYWAHPAKTKALDDRALRK